MALEALKLEPGERKAWWKTLRHLLRAGQSGKGTTGLAARAREEPPELAVWTPMAYLERHAAGLPMDDRKYRQPGVPLSSGTLESALRRVVNLGRKGTGIRWSEGNAEALLVLRAAALTDRWEESLEPVWGSMATDRWLEWQWTSGHARGTEGAGREQSGDAAR